jgi:hypothetical protein
MAAVARSIGMIVLAIFLIVYGLLALIPSLTIPYSGIILGLLALIAGILILLGR